MKYLKFFLVLKTRERYLIISVLTAFKENSHYLRSNRFLDHQLKFTGRIFLPSVGNIEVDGQGQL
jgi:hypothetical protein